jgi:hypothetical protein
LHLAAELYKPNTAEVFLTQGAERRPGALQRNYRHGGGGGTALQLRHARRLVAARGWGPHDVDDKTWDDAFSKLAEALTGRKDVATVVQLSRMGIISDREGVLEGYVITGKKGGYTQAEGFDAYVKSFGGKDVYFVTPGKRGGGGFLVGFSDDKSLYRWTNYGFFDKLRRFGFVKRFKHC